AKRTKKRHSRIKSNYSEFSGIRKSLSCHHFGRPLFYPAEKPEGVRKERNRERKPSGLSFAFCQPFLKHFMPFQKRSSFREKTFGFFVE
ncbi:MAG TPA: hypothetical protein PK597_04675, partial [Oscillospiraceae bacterium]|nr:hypothetical protein [Oscillospiraceae bacterium]